MNTFNSSNYNDLFQNVKLVVKETPKQQEEKVFVGVCEQLETKRATGTRWHVLREDIAKKKKKSCDCPHRLFD